jgi:N,N-dimethylformamidase
MAYSDKVSVAGGESIKFMVSCAGPDYKADIVRLIHGDPNPAGPGRKEVEVATPVSRFYTGRIQALRCGSFAVAPDTRRLKLQRGFTLFAWIYSTTPLKGIQGVLTKWCADDQAGFGLFIDETGALAMAIGTPNGVVWLGTGRPLRSSTWYLAACTYDAATELVLYQIPQTKWPVEDSRAIVRRASGSSPIRANDCPIHIAAFVERSQIASGHFNGKIDTPMVFSRPLSSLEIESLSLEGHAWRASEDLEAAWDFSVAVDTDLIVDRSRHGRHGHTVNLPSRAITGRSWKGYSHSHFKDVPDMYGAIHFHDDDVGDAGWLADFELTVPDNLKSGVYAARLISGESEYRVPFVVRPANNSPRAPILFLLPTLSYHAYANFRWFDSREVASIPAEQVGAPQPEDELLKAHPELGRSVYDYHSDGSPVYYSSWFRPIVSLSPKYKHPPWRSAHLLAADLSIVDWLTVKSHPFDVASDHDLHKRGKALLEPYRVVVLGAHPEYWTEPMMQGLESYMDGGGRLMYLGGNGLYWVTALDSRGATAEVRRWLGTRTNSANDGEFYLSTGELGGIWRARGRPPQKLVGVGFTSQGGPPGRPFRRMPDSFKERARFIFEGIGDDEVIGDFGLCVEAAGGFEIDRVDPAWGTPPHTLVLASATKFGRQYLHVVEEVGVMSDAEHGEASDKVRADMVFYEHPGGGAVFSASSISWSGSLSHNNYDNNVSRITENVLRRFLSPEQFLSPVEA